MTCQSISFSACLACDGCKRNGGTCVQPDDTAELIQKIYDADILVFGTPVYFWGMSAQLKMVVDKLYSRDDALKKLDKKVGLVTILGQQLLMIRNISLLRIRWYVSVTISDGS